MNTILLLSALTAGQYAPPPIDLEEIFREAERTRARREAEAERLRPDPRSPREKRARMERAVARVGECARGLVEAHSDAACLALSACSPEVGRELAKFYSDGGMRALPSAKALLVCIAAPTHGDEVASFAARNGKLLEDPVMFSLYVKRPLDYALRLRSLEADAAEERARPPRAAWVPEFLQSIDAKTWGLFGLGAIMFALLFQVRRLKGRLRAAPVILTGPPGGRP